VTADDTTDDDNQKRKGTNIGHLSILLSPYPRTRESRWAYGGG
jgi:hypothetical protein